MIGPETWALQALQKGRAFGADGDAFHGRFTPQGFRSHMDRLAPHRKRCLFMAPPDVRVDCRATLELFRRWEREICDRSFPPAYAAQDGSEHFNFPPLARALFIGGSDPWREAHTGPLIRRAQQAGLWTHLGRVNSRRRMFTCAAIGTDSADGTHVRFQGKQRGVKEITGWLNACGQPQLALETA